MNNFLSESISELEPILGSLHAKHRRIYIASALILLMEVAAYPSAKVGLFGLDVAGVRAWHIEAISFLVVAQALIGAFLLLISANIKSSISQIYSDLSEDPENFPFPKNFSENAISDFKGIYNKELSNYHSINIANIVFQNALPALSAIAAIIYSSNDFIRLFVFVISQTQGV